MKRFHFQVNTQISYQVAEIEAETFEEAEQKLHQFYFEHPCRYERIVHKVENEPADDLNGFMGVNVL